MEDKEMFEIFDGMDRVNREMHKEMMSQAPSCHFRPMIREMSDSIDGCYEEWWECSVCGCIK